MSASSSCDICQCQVPTGGWDSHVRGKAHCRKAGLRTEAVLQSAHRDRNGVSVSTPDNGLDFGVVDPGRIPETMKFFILKATTESSEFLVLDPQWTSGSRSVGTQTARGRDVRIIVRLRTTEIGRYEDILEIRFARLSNNQQFSVTRRIKAVVGDATGYALLLPAAPYVPRRRANRQEITGFVSGVAPPRLLAIAWRTNLGKYRIPKTFRPILSLPPNRSDNGEDIVPTQIRSLFPGALRLSSHANAFCLLQWLEEIAMEDALRVYDMESVRLTKHGVYYHLPVPGLAEKRPSVIIGDTVLAQMNGAAHDRWYEGHVHYLRQAEVALRFHGSFPKDGTQQFDVRFQVNRVPLRRQHQALRANHYAPHLLFPGPTHARTGKTVTIVEAIKQILHRDPSARVLACAPSNSAADIIAQRLSVLLQTNSLFRFYAPSREKKTVPPDLLPYTFENRDGLFSHPPLDTVKSFRVVVCTCTSAAFTLGIGVERGHFSHVFIDEAGQATEPEAMVVVKNVANASTKLILSGDPKQLRPIIHSAIANELGLGISYLERLMECNVYRRSNDGSSGVVKLLSNYRSHPTIIQYPSERFYDGELEACGEPSSVNSCLNLETLVRDRYPVIFCAVEGQDAREASSPSFFNPEEVLQVKAYVQQLLADTRARYILNRVKEPAHIGVIAPYRAQCMKLRAALRQIAPEIKIGSVEEYQGDERRIIIITTVRSSRDYINYDLRHTLGFVANPRRFNVAVTRAKALLIMIGDPLVLGLDPLWRAYLNSVHAGGGWRGRQIPWDPLASVNPDGGYDADLRVRALSDVDALAQRLLDEADFDDADEDQPFREPED
ncbi:P-loop containing nucleoside triphosphate hydrolase protein [Russula compacta]|nr:P-loop containing nucleoside triphosphate hydrolase protein [Russula compacta]